jgi:TonB family protein
MNRSLTCTLIVTVIVATAAVSADAADALAPVRALYTSADYESALALLDQMGTVEDRDVVDVDQYRALCYVALGDTERARRAIEHLVSAQPEYRLSGDAVSPRVEALFADVRHQVLPDVVKRAFASAKDAYTAGDVAGADRRFRALLRLLDDPELAGMTDLRTIVKGFVDLTGERLRPVPAPAVAAADRTSAGPASAPVIYSADTRGIIPPTAISQTLPRFTAALKEPLHGVMTVVIGEDGRVVNARMQSPTNTAYDEIALSAARKWQYRPAVLNGKPVRFAKAVNVNVTPAQTR